MQLNVVPATMSGTDLAIKPLCWINLNGELYIYANVWDRTLRIGHTRLPFDGRQVTAKFSARNQKSRAEAVPR
jgi:hypothetical protein